MLAGFMNLELFAKVKLHNFSEEQLKNYRQEIITR